MACAVTTRNYTMLCNYAIMQLNLKNLRSVNLRSDNSRSTLYMSFVFASVLSVVGERKVLYFGNITFLERNILYPVIVVGHFKVYYQWFRMLLSSRLCLWPHFGPALAQ